MKLKGSKNKKNKRSSKTHNHKPCKFRKREEINGVDIDMCYAIGVEEVGDIPCEYCVDRKCK